MKKNYFPYAFAIILSLITHTALCMEHDPAERSDRKALTTQLEKLREEQKEEEAFNSGRCIRYNLTYTVYNEMSPVSDCWINDPQRGSHDKLIQSDDKLVELSKQIKDIEKKLSQPE